MPIFAKRLESFISNYAYIPENHWTEQREQEEHSRIKFVRHAAFVAEREHAASVTPRTFLAMPLPIAARVQRHIDSHVNAPCWAARAFTYAKKMRRECWLYRNAALRRESYEQWKMQYDNA